MIDNSDKFYVYLDKMEDNLKKYAVSYQIIFV